MSISNFLSGTLPLTNLWALFEGFNLRISHFGLVLSPCDNIWSSSAHPSYLSSRPSILLVCPSLVSIQPLNFDLLVGLSSLILNLVSDHPTSGLTVTAFLSLPPFGLLNPPPPSLDCAQEDNGSPLWILFTFHCWPRWIGPSHSSGADPSQLPSVILSLMPSCLCPHFQVGWPHLPNSLCPHPHVERAVTLLLVKIILNFKIYKKALSKFFLKHLIFS